MHARARISSTTRHLAAGLSLVIAALGLLAWWTWQSSVRRHQVAVGLLRSHAELAAQRLADRLQAELYIGGKAVFDAARASGRSARDSSIAPQSVIDAARLAESCNCAPPLRPAFAFRIDSAPAGTAFAGGRVPDARDREALSRIARAQLDRISASWEIAVLRNESAVGGRLVLVTRERRGGGPSALLGIATDSATLREFVIRPVFCNTRLVLAGGALARTPNDSLVAIRVTDASGTVLYATPARVDSALANTARLPSEWGDLAVTASLTSLGAESVVPGGIPRSPLPTVVALILAASTLVGIATVLIWRVQQLGRLRSQFTASVSHELRTPLTQILLYAETLEMDRQRSPARRAEALGVITRETRRLIHLVENVLHFSRAERSLTRLRLRPAEIGAIVGDVVRSFAPIAGSRGMSLAVDTDGVQARVDPDAMRRVLLNLLDNAVRYGAPEQTITVRVRGTGDVARIAVDDEGPGVPPAMREAVWQPFVRLDADHQTNATGCGIGLSIVRDLVDLQGGRCEITSSRSGGASFVIELPAIDGGVAAESDFDAGLATLGGGVP